MSAESADLVASGVRIALVTIPDAWSAEALGRAAVEEGLAACGNGERQETGVGSGGRS